MGADGTTASGRLEGQVAIVTGGASGIGAEVVRRFAAEGARQVVVGLPEEEARATALVDDLGGDRILFVAGDVADPGTAARATAAAAQRISEAAKKLSFVCRSCRQRYVPSG